MKSKCILIEPLYRSTFSFGFLPIKSPIQNRSFIFGFKITNGGTKAFEGIIKNIVFKSAEDKNLFYKPLEELSIKKINSGESIKVYLPTPIKINLYGLIIIKCYVTAEDPNEKIVVERISEVTSKREIIEKLEDDNIVWFTSSYMHGQVEAEQARTNGILFYLTVVTTLHSIWGLDNIYRSLIHILHNFFFHLAEIFKT